MKLQEALAYRAKIENAAAFQDDENALESIELFPKWTVGIEVKTGERYQHQALLWRVVQDHTTQADWEPQNTPALFVPRCRLYKKPPGNLLPFYGSH